MSELRAILVETFPTATIPLSCDELMLGGFPEWDSLGNFNFLLAIEEFYDVRFDIEQMSKIKSIAQIITALLDFDKVSSDDT
jgi:acyl carrier protein